MPKLSYDLKRMRVLKYDEGFKKQSRGTHGTHGTYGTYSTYGTYGT